MSNILFALTGSISCYKACAAISSLVQKGHNVQCVATPSALEFVGKATLEGLTKKSVLTSSFCDGKMMAHIDFVRNTDLFAVCPATAHTINSLANGTHSGLLGDLFLANNFLKPTLIFPAMNHQMINYPATQDAIQKLKFWGAKIFESPIGGLACGEYGQGRLLEPQDIVQEIELELNSKKNTEAFL